MNEEIWEFVAAERQNYPIRSDLHAAILEHFPGTTLGYSTLTRALRREHWSEEARSSAQKPGPQRDPNLTHRIKDALDADPTLSCRQIARQLAEPEATVRSYLHDVLGYVYKKTRWVPHTLTADQKKLRVERSKALLQTIKKAERTNFRFFLTGDESWFFHSSPTRGLWLPPDDAAPEAQKPTHYAPKTMITIFWNPSGALHVCALPDSVTWSAQYFIDHTLKPLIETECYKQCRKQRRKFTIHMDNARVHTASIVQTFLDENGFVCAPHPPYSPDLAPSDFYLFGTLKERIRGIEFEDAGAIVRWIIDEFEQIPTRELQAAFNEWKQRLARVKCSDGSYLT